MKHNLPNLCKWRMAAVMLLLTGGSGIPDAWSQTYAPSGDTGPKSLPYSCRFSDLGPDGVAREWTIVDNNEDGSTWGYNDWQTGPAGVQGVMNCGGNYMGDRTGDDWLISPAIQFNAGTNHIALQSRNITGISTETLELYVGTSLEVSEMTQIASFTVKDNEWTPLATNFTLDSDGAYYMAIRCHSVEGMNLFADEIEVSQGEMEMLPELTVVDVKLPWSDCDLSDETTVGVVIKNTGLGVAEEFTMTMEVNGNKIATEQKSLTLNPTEVATVYFDTKADLSEEDEYYVDVTLNYGEGSSSSGTGYVEHYSPVTQFPVNVNFSTKENFEFFSQMTPGSWVYEEYFSEFSTDQRGLEKGLLSHCASLGSKARVRVAYGGTGFGNASMYVAYGKSGTDPNFFQKAYEDRDFNGEKEATFDIDLPSAGNYTFMIVNDTPEGTRASLKLYQFDLSEVLDNDIAVTAVESPFAVQTPVKQAEGTLEYLVTVKNNGLREAQEITARIKSGDRLLGESIQSINLASGECATIAVPVAFSDMEVGESLEYTAEASFKEADMYAADNVYIIPITTLTETTLASECSDNLSVGTGGNGMAIRIGDLYNIPAMDVLTGVNIGFAPTYEGNPIIESELGFSLYKVEDDGKTLSDRIYSGSFVRGLGGWISLDVPNVRLTPGKYFFEVEQTGTTNMGISLCQEGKDLVCYQNADGMLAEAPGATLMIRGEFAKGAVALAKDASVVAIINPVRREALFSSEETVTATVRNAGYEGAEVEVTFRLDGTLKAKKHLSLKPYESVSVDFAEVDLSKAGEHTVAISVVMDGDENPDNNQISVVFTTPEELSPYKMDFEGCGDFDISTDQFNPKWKSYDRNNQSTDMLWRYNHPHRGEPVGFLVWNRNATTPAIGEGELPEIYPHSGERFGLAFCTGWRENAVSDVWLVSPKLKLGKNSLIRLYAKGNVLETQQRIPEQFRILVSETDDDFDSFRVIGDNPREAGVDSWAEITQELSAYDGKEIHVAIQYIGEPLKNQLLMLDDIEVITEISGVNGVTDSGRSISYYPEEGIVKVTSETAIGEIGIYTIDGAVVLCRTGIDTESYSIGVSRLAKGIYIVKSGLASSKIQVK